MGTLRDLIRRAASRKIGMLTSDIAEFSVHQVGLACYKMAAKGELHKVHLGKRVVRYFKSKEAADALRARLDLPSVERRELEARLLRRREAQRREWDATEAQITENTLFTQCPSFTPQFAGLCGNGVNVFGGNQRGRVIPRHLALERMRAAP